MAATVLGLLDELPAWPELVANVTGGDFEVRASAVRALGRLGLPQAADAVTACLDPAERPELRALAARALGGIGDPRSGPALAACLDDPHYWVAHNGAVALAALGEAGEAELARAGHGEGSGAAHAREALARRVLAGGGTPATPARAGAAPAPAGHAPAGHAPAGHAPAGQARSGQARSGRLLAGRIPAGRAPADETPAGQAPAGQAPAARLRPRPEGRPLMAAAAAAAIRGFAWFAIFYFVVLNSIYLVLIVMAAGNAIRARSRMPFAGLAEIFASPLAPPISIVVPVCNMQDLIVGSARGLLGLRYPEFEVIIVDDGSTDATFARLEAEFGLVQVDKVIRDTVYTAGRVLSVHAPRDGRSLLVIRKQGLGGPRTPSTWA